MTDVADRGMPVVLSFHDRPGERPAPLGVVGGQCAVTVMVEGARVVVQPPAVLAVQLRQVMVMPVMVVMPRVFLVVVAPFAGLLQVPAVRC